MSTISDYALGFYDGPHATPKESEHGPIFLGIKNVTPDGRLDFSTIRHVSPEEFPRWTKRVTPTKGDIVFSYEATLHRYALIPEGFIGCLGRRMALIRPDPEKVDSRFLHYYMMSSAWRKEAEASIISCATVDRIPLTKVPDFKVTFPDLTEQVRVASLLSAYDDLIENNWRRIALLEEVARLLYREWFVHFRFPGAEHAKIFDGVPEGWARMPLGDVSTIRKGKNITKNTVKPGSVPVVAGGLSPAYFHDTANTKSPTITVSASGANAGFVNLYFQDIWASDCSFLDSNANIDIFYLYLLLKGNQAEISSMQKGAAQPHVYPKDLMRLEIAFPPEAIRADFMEYVSPQFEMVKTLKNQIKASEIARDLLLPRLMDGRLEI